jgi:cytosine deaminase
MTHEPAFFNRLLDIAYEEAQEGLAEGGVPVGAALFDRQGRLLGRGHNRRVQEGDPSIHGETDAFRKAGRVKGGYRDTIMATTLAPCWFCSGLIRQFNIGTVVVGESVNFPGGVDWLREHGFQVIDLQSEKCVEMMRQAEPLVRRHRRKRCERISVQSFVRGSTEADSRLVRYRRIRTLSPRNLMDVCRGVGAKTVKNFIIVLFWPRRELHWKNPLGLGRR